MAMKMIPLQEQPAKSEIVAEQRKEVKFIGTLRKVPGLTLFEFDTNTGTLKPATYKSVAATMGGKIRYTAVLNPGCYYVQALNAKNAIKKILKAKQ